MIREQLDDLLNASAPATQRIDAPDVRAMVRASRIEAAPREQSRRRVLAGGVLSLLFIGGAGVATATSDWSWISGLDESVRSYSYTSPTWGQCEIRLSGIDTHDIFIQSEVDRIVDDWFARTDVESAAAPYVDDHLAVLEDAREADPDSREDLRGADLDAWTAHEQALNDALFAELATHGYGTDRLAGADSYSQVHCDGEEWGGEGGDR